MLFSWLTKSYQEEWELQLWQGIEISMAVDKNAVPPARPASGELPSNLKLLDMTDLHKLYEGLALRGQLFKPGGEARKLSVQYTLLHQEMYRRAMDTTKYKTAYEKATIAANDSYSELQVIRQKIKMLEETQFSLEQFNGFAKRIYKILGRVGPEIKNAVDLSKFADYVYANMDRSSEPDVP
jgi:hypothetical protein